MKVQLDLYRPFSILQRGSNSCLFVPDPVQNPLYNEASDHRHSAKLQRLYNSITAVSQQLSTVFLSTPFTSTIIITTTTNDVFPIAQF